MYMNYGCTIILWWFS